jgi:NAD(P)-dependent dehydrogenase (short-subunit alcohol dehydrogenase family)
MPAALVTGASSGIGRAIAQERLEAGWDVTAVSRDPARGGLSGAHEVAADLTDEEACIAAVAAHRERFGRLDLLVNAAGVGLAHAVDGYPAKAWDLQFALNVRGLYVVTREALDLIRDADGLVVNLASVAGVTGARSLSAYSATKHAVVGYTRSLVEEGVRATAICPGFVNTPMSDWMKGTIPPERMIQPEDVAATVRFLLELTPPCIVPEVVLKRRTEEPL